MKTQNSFIAVISELDEAIGAANRAGSQAFEARKYDQVRDAADRAAKLVALRDKLAPFSQEWAAAMGVAATPAPAAKVAATKAAKAPAKKKAAKAEGKPRLKRGSSLPEAAYIKPILTVLDQVGGKADVQVVHEKVRELMSPVLKDVDLAAFASDPKMPRWKHAVQRARLRLIKDGALRGDSPRGEWEITDAGRQRLTA